MPTQSHASQSDDVAEQTPTPDNGFVRNFAEGFVRGSLSSLESHPDAVIRERFARDLYTALNQYAGEVLHTRRLAFKALHDAGHSYDQIAQLTGVSKAVVGDHIRRVTPQA